MRSVSRMIDELFDEGTLAMSDRIAGLFDLNIWENEDYEDVEDLEAILASGEVRGDARRR